MAPKPEFYLAGTGTLATQVTVTLDAGTAQSPASYDLWNWKGASGDPLRNARLRLEVWNGTQWVTSGYPPVDELWGRLAITGSIKTGDSTMADQTKIGRAHV